MLRLLNIEWLKIRKYKAFIIVGIIFIVGVVLTNYLVYVVFNNLTNGYRAESDMLLKSFKPYGFDNVWQTVSYVSGYTLILPAILLVILVTNEYAFKTHRQNVIDGWSRSEFHKVKIQVAIFFAALATLIVIITGLIFGFSTGGSFSLAGFGHVGYFFLKTLSYNLLAILFSIWIKRTGIAIAVYFVYLVIENFISQLLLFGSIKIKTGLHLDLGNMGDYLPMNASDGLLTFPDNPLKSMTNDIFPSNYHSVTLIFTCFYLFLFYYLSKRSFLKRDL